MPNDMTLEKALEIVGYLETEGRYFDHIKLRAVSTILKADYDEIDKSVYYKCLKWYWNFHNKR